MHRIIIRTKSFSASFTKYHVRNHSSLTNDQMQQYLSRKPYTLPDHKKIVSPPLVYISGEEMTRYTMELILEQWIKPHIDISNWKFYDLSCKARDNTADKVLHDAVAAGKEICSIFKEPTITPSAAQVKEFGLKKAWGSPNGAMRKGWNGISISRDTIHIEGVKLGFDKPVLFDRHAVGGEYGAGWLPVGAGRLLTTFFPDDGSSPITCDDRVLKDKNNVVVTYHNPLDNVSDLAHHFFSRCLESNIVPYVVTKKTVFKWQEGFWKIMKTVFDASYREKFMSAGIIPDGNLQHLISDSATMQIIRWTKGGFGMAAHNYDGDMLTDEIAQVHRSPGFITSNLVGKREDGTMIKEFEASHGTVADLWHAHLRGEATSMNPLGMADALICAIAHSAELHAAGDQEKLQIKHFCATLKQALHNTFRYGQGTKDMSGPAGLSTEQFVDKVAWRLGRYLAATEEDLTPQDLVVPSLKFRRNYDVDSEVLQKLFKEYDQDGDGTISMDEFEHLLHKIGVVPKKDFQQSKRKDNETL